MASIQEIQKYLEAEIAAVNEVIFTHLKGKDDLIQLIGSHLINAGGKRIRPMLTILTGKMFNYNGEHAIKLATAIEFIHVATLLHDDVVDNSSMRRFKPTANFIWGNKASILVGDYLLSQAFKLMIEVGLISTLESVASATALLIRGEVKQLESLNEAKIINQQLYEQIINAKTAELFGAACEVGAIIAGKDQQTSLLLREFGIMLGKIFQIADDLLDYLGTAETIGKNPGDDFFEGKATLPIILLQDKLPENRKADLAKLFQLPERTNDQFKNTKKLLQEYEIEQDIILNIKTLQITAENLITHIAVDIEICKDYLISLLSFSINRTH